MGIEIRPAAVMAQIEAKKGLLDGLIEEVRSKQKSVWGFVQDDLLQGTGYEAAKERVFSYGAVLAAIEAAAECTKEVDASISAALSGYFGDCARVSEDEWLDKQREALAQRDLLSSQNFQAQTGPVGVLVVREAFESAIQSAQDSADYAADMLSKIYSYCSETNGAYRDVEGLNAWIARGTSAIAASGYSPTSGRWGKLDLSWKSELVSMAVKVSEKTHLKESRDNPSTAFFSSDHQYVYYQGEKWRIDGGAAEAYPWEDKGEQLLPGWSDEGRIDVDYSKFDNMLFWGLFLSGFGSSFQSAEPQLAKGEWASQ